MLKRLVLSVAVLATVPAHAEGITGEEVIGTMLGAVVGSAFGGGQGRVAMTAVGAVVGNQMAKNYEQRERDYRPPMAGQYPARPRNPMEACVGEGFYNGEYNPQAAAMYCRGLQDAAQIRQSRIEGDAYRAGLNTFAR